MNNTRWIYKEQVGIDTLSNKISPTINDILKNRKIITEEAAKKFINPSLSQVSSPFAYQDVEKAAKRIIKAIENQEEIWIYGDYDVDGITSSALCFLALKELGAKVRYYIPVRDEGYGLNCEALKQISAKGAKIVITVDCGISSIEEVDYGSELGLEMIITDHHEINKELPRAYAVVNPKRLDNEYNFPSLAGVGTAYILLMGIFTLEKRLDDLEKYLDIVAIGTVADIVPLVSENRIFTKHGLKQLENTEHIGLKTLLKVIFDDDKEVYNTYDIGFRIAPVFNAAGRLEDAKQAVELLTTNSIKEAELLTKKLIEQNFKRKEIQTAIHEEVEEFIQSNNLQKAGVIVASGRDYHHGVIGIVASKIVDKYYRPTIIMEEKIDQGIAVASCRSIEGYNIASALKEVEELLIKHGGHAGAAGFSIKLENIPEFIQRINEHAKISIEDELYNKPIKIERKLFFHEVNYNFIRSLEILEPFGFGNPTPLFSLQNCQIQNIRLIGKDKSHLLLNLIKDGYELKNVVWFGSGEYFEELIDFKNIDIVFKLKLEKYLGRYQNKIYIEDARRGSEEEKSLSYYKSLYETEFPVKFVCYSRSKPELKKEYSLSGDYKILQGKKIITNIPKEVEVLIKKLKEHYNWQFKVKLDKVEECSENNNLYFSLEKDNTFKTLAIKEGAIFKEIKNHLLSELPYNSLQKKVLSTFYKKNKRVFVETNVGRGIGIIIKTIALFNQINDERTLVISKEPLLPKDTFYIENTREYKPGYKTYIYLDVIPENKVLDEVIVFSNKNLKLSGFDRVEDDLELPKNIDIVSEDNFLKSRDQESAYYSRYLPIRIKKELLKNIEYYQKIITTKDILSLL